MTIFLFSLMTIIIISILVNLSTKQDREKCDSKSYKKRFIIIVTIALTIIYGFREYNVGIDTSSYFIRFQYANQLNIISVIQSVSKEWGYVVVEYIVSRYLNSFTFMLLFIGGLYSIAIGKIIYRFAPYPLLAYFLFFSLGFFSFGMTALRQTIAISIILFSVHSVVDKKLFTFLILVSLASTFHVTAVIFLPAYLVNYLKLNKKTIALSIVTLFLVVLLQDDIREIGLNLFNRQIESQDIGGYLYYVFLIVSIILGLIFRNKFSLPNNRAILLFLIMAMILFPITQFHPAVSRLYFYYSIMLIIYIPMLIQSIKDIGFRCLILISYITVLSYLLIFKIAPAAQLENYSMIFW